MWGSLSLDDEEDNTDSIFGSGLSKGGGGGGLWEISKTMAEAQTRKPPLGKKNINLFSEFNFNNDSDLSIFDNGGFTSGSKDESLFPSLYTSGDQYNVDNENLSNLTFVNSLAAQPQRPTHFFLRCSSLP